MSFPRYPAYKDSGHDWLGFVPGHWSVAKFRHSFFESPEKIEGEVVGPMLSVSGYRGVEIKEYDDENRKRTDEELLGYRIVRPGQLVVNTMWLNYAGLGVSEHEGHVSPAYRSYWITEELDRRYAHHLMRSSVYVGGYTKFITGIRPNSLQMGREDLMVFPVIQPPKAEQVQIADFLDDETAKIDALVAEQEQLITLLKEKRQAVISHAVTKGLDPSVPMKDSGVEWLGEVPAHWRTSALKHICDVRDGTHDTPQFLAPSEDTFPFVTTKDLGGGRVSFEEAKHISREDFENFARRSRVDLGDVLMPMIGSIGGAVLVDTGEAFAIKNIALFKGADHFDPRWLTHFLNSDLSSVQFDLNRSGGVQGFVALSVLRDLRIPVPPKIEQVEIADSLSKALANINDLIGLASESIATLQERRATLISAAVTGQIDIRGESNDIKS
jgi:type I restriction enzyme S subunit